MNTQMSARIVHAMAAQGLVNIETERRLCHERERDQIQHTELIARVRTRLGIPRTDAEVERIRNARRSDLFTHENMDDLYLDSYVKKLRLWQDMAIQSASGYLLLDVDDLYFLRKWSTDYK